MRSSISSFRRPIYAILAACGLVFLSARIAEVQMGYSPEGEKTERWLSDVGRFRTGLFEATPIDKAKPTVWVVAGSNALFGTDSELIEKTLGVNARNYSLQGSVHPNIMFSQIIDQVRPGDVVWAPLEFGVYDRRLGSVFDYSNYFRNMRSWINHLRASDLYSLYTAVPLKRWVDGLAAYIYAPAAPEEILDIQSMKKLWDKKTKYGSYYSFLSLTDRGDFLIDADISPGTWESDVKLEVNNEIGPVGIATLRDWQKKFEARGAKFVLTLPILLEDKYGTVTSPDFWESIESQRKQLAEIDVPIHCPADISVLGRVYRLDSIYHVNSRGARLRTANILPCLADALAGRPSLMTKIDPQSAALTARRLFQQQDGALISSQ